MLELILEERYRGGGRVNILGFEIIPSQVETAADLRLLGEKMIERADEIRGLT